MISKDQARFEEYIERLKKVYQVYSENPTASMTELAGLTGINKNTCNRYLNDEDAEKYVGSTLYDLVQSLRTKEPKEAKMLKVIKAFLEHPVSLEELAIMTGVSSSSCQRYLNDSEFITTVLGKDIYEQVQKQLKENRLESQIKGGEVSSTVNEPLRGEQGKFSGNIPRR